MKKTFIKAGVWQNYLLTILNWKQVSTNFNISGFQDKYSQIQFCQQTVGNRKRIWNILQKSQILHNMYIIGFYFVVFQAFRYVSLCFVLDYDGPFQGHPFIPFYAYQIALKLNAVASVDSDYICQILRSTYWPLNSIFFQYMGLTDKPKIPGWSQRPTLVI